MNYKNFIFPVVLYVLNVYSYSNMSTSVDMEYEYNTMINTNTSKFSYEIISQKNGTKCVRGISKNTEKYAGCHVGCDVCAKICTFFRLPNMCCFENQCCCYYNSTRCLDNHNCPFTWCV